MATRQQCRAWSVGHRPRRRRASSSATRRRSTPASAQRGQHPAQDAAPGRVLRWKPSDLGERGHHDQVKEQLERCDLVLVITLEAGLKVGYSPTLCGRRDGVAVGSCSPGSEDPFLRSQKSSLSSSYAVVEEAVADLGRGQRGEMRTDADFGPSPCMVGTAELPGYFAS